MKAQKNAWLESVLHIGKALHYSLCGLGTGLRLSLAFRQEVLVLFFLLLALCFTGKGPGTWLLCVGAWLLVMVAELLNTAVEETLNLITRDFSLAVKAAKDMASAAVFLLLLLNGGVWLYVFGPDVQAILQATG